MPPNYWDLKFDLTRRFKEAFDAKGLTSPYPQQDVYMHQVKAARGFRGRWLGGGSVFERRNQAFYRLIAAKRDSAGHAV
jgi:hypothetical protein